MSQNSFSSEHSDRFSHSTSRAQMLPGPSTQAALPGAFILVSRECPGEPPFTCDEWLETDPDQSWYWTPGWQAAEQEAEEDFRIGSYQRFATMDDFIDSLRDLMAEA